MFPTFASNMELEAYMLFGLYFQSVSFWSLLRNKMITGLSDINQHLSQISHSQLKSSKAFTLISIVSGPNFMKKHN